MISAVLLIMGGCSSNKSTENYQPTRQLPPQPQEASPKTRAQLHTDLGAGYFERGQMEVALQELNEAVTADPTYAPAYNIFGLVYSVLGQDAKAQQSFERAIELAPSDPEIRHNWGWYLCSHKRERDSLVQFNAAIADPLYKTPEIAMANAGRCAQEMGDLRLAEAYFRRAIAIAPSNQNASYGLAIIAYKEARYPEARTYIRAAVQTNAPAPESLYLGMCVERKLGDRDGELSYISQLRNRYPESAETKAIASARCG